MKPLRAPTGYQSIPLPTGSAWILPRAKKSLLAGWGKLNPAFPCVGRPDDILRPLFFGVGLPSFLFPVLVWEKWWFDPVSMVDIGDD